MRSTRRRRGAAALRRTLLVPVVNATGVLLHTNLGRAPLAHHQDARGAVGRARPGDGRARVAPAGRRAVCSPALCGGEDAIVVNNNAAAVLLVLAALARRAATCR